MHARLERGTGDQVGPLAPLIAVREHERLDQPLARGGQHELLEGAVVEGGGAQPVDHRDAPGLGREGKARDHLVMVGVQIAESLAAVEGRGEARRWGWNT